jgi:hypothetical protein
MVGVLSQAFGFPYFNVMMSSGKQGNLEYSGNKQEIKMNKSEPVAKISVY